MLLSKPARPVTIGGRFFAPTFAHACSGSSNLGQKWREVRDQSSYIHGKIPRGHSATAPASRHTCLWTTLAPPCAVLRTSLCGTDGLELLAKPGLQHSFTRATTDTWPRQFVNHGA